MFFTPVDQAILPATVANPRHRAQNRSWINRVGIDKRSTTPYMPWQGATCCMLSAVFYTGANICLRQLAEIEADPAWVVCLKETTAVVVLGPWLLWQYLRGSRPACHPRILLMLFAAAIAVQLVGNLGVQWAYGIVGLVVSLPMIFGAILIGSVIMGTLLFKEILGRRSIVAIAAVAVSIVLLSVGATTQNGVTTDSAGLLLTSLAIAAAGLGGTVYAVMGAVLRYAANARISVPGIVVIVTGTGTLTLGTVCLIRLGPTELLATDRTMLAWVIASGLCNMVAFSLITKGIQLTTLAHANVLNASQVALGALAGVLLFHEPYNTWVLGGLFLTILGIGMFGDPRETIPAEPL